MTDRELLELAAKAAGYIVESMRSNGGAWCHPVGELPDEDGDALGDDADEDGADEAAAGGANAARPAARGSIAERKRQEREARKFAAENAAEERRKKREDDEARAIARQEAQEAREKLEAEELARLREEANQAKKAEYSVWKSMLQVDSTGNAAASEDEVLAAHAKRLDDVPS